MADAKFLPFKERCFRKVYCLEVLEHVPKPQLVIKELLRVAKQEIHILTPHRLAQGLKHEFHINYFNVKWFDKFLAKMKRKGVIARYRIEVNLRILKVLGLPTFLAIPSQLKVKIIKQPAS